jgi:hypothetical protein
MKLDAGHVEHAANGMGAGNRIRTIEDLKKITDPGRINDVTSPGMKIEAVDDVRARKERDANTDLDVNRQSPPPDRN